MAKFGDVVLFLQKNGDDVVKRAAVVLGSNTHVPLNASRQPMEGVEPEEHLDLAIVAESAPRVVSMESVFRQASSVRPYDDARGAGWEPLFAKPAEAPKGSLSDFATYELATELERRMPDMVFMCVPRDKEAPGSGTERYGDASDWTAAGQDATGFPVPKGSPEDVTTQQAPAPESEQGTADGQPSAADLDAHAEDEAAKAATSDDAPEQTGETSGASEGEQEQDQEQEQEQDEEPETQEEHTQTVAEDGRP